MTPDELRALADALDDCDPPYYESSPQINRSLDACIAKAADYLRAQAETHPASAVPAGYKLVPVEATPEMLEAVGMMDGYDCHAPRCSPDADHANWYRAMIAAAPAAPQPVDRCRSSETSDPKATGRSSPERPASNREDAAATVAAGSGEQAEPKREPLSDAQIDVALQADPAMVLALMSGDLTVGEFKAALRRLARTVLRAHGIGGSDAE